MHCVKQDLLLLWDWVSGWNYCNEVLYSDLRVALAVYDVVLSFPMELKAVWKRRFGTGTFLYLSIRYGTVIAMLFGNFQRLLITENLIVSIKNNGDWHVEALMWNIGVRIISFLEVAVFELQGSCKILYVGGTLFTVYAHFAYSGK